MKRPAAAIGLILIGIMSVSIAGCGKSNLFSWAHNAGDKKDDKALSSDAYVALQNKDYAKALEYYQEMLKNDPTNSEAIYGYSAAKLADAGIDLGGLVANLVRNQNASSISGLSPSIAQAANASYTPAFAANILPDSILNNLPAIKVAINAVLADDKLKKIIKGEADGKISPTNADVNLNLAFCLVLRAAITVQESGAITIGSDYKITVNTIDVGVANTAGRDIASAAKRLEVVVRALNLASDGTIANIKKDVNDLYVDLQAKISGLTVDINHDYYLD